MEGTTVKSQFEWRGYLVRPAGATRSVSSFTKTAGSIPNRDVASCRCRFLTQAPDGLSPIGGYPGNDDDGRAMQRSLDGDKLRQDMVMRAEPRIIDRKVGSHWFLLGWQYDESPAVWAATTGGRPGKRSRSGEGKQHSRRHAVTPRTTNASTPPVRATKRPEEAGAKCIPTPVRPWFPQQLDPALR